MIEEIGKKIEFLWIPEHSGITGKEHADAAAKLAHQTNSISPSPMTPEELAKEHFQKNEEGWNKMWWECPNAKLKMEKKTTKPWNTSYRDNRREEVVLARLRLGHTKLTHGYLMAREDAPLCITCNESLTVRHIFENCRRYETLLHKHNITPDIGEALNDDNGMLDRAFLFLKESNLYSEM